MLRKTPRKEQIAFVASPGNASAASGVQFGIQDDAWLEHGPGTLSSRVATLDRLEQRLPVLAEGPADAPDRQRTLHATIAWSFDLLTEDEQRVFTAVSVFSGGFVADAAESLAGDPP